MTVRRWWPELVVVLAVCLLYAPIFGGRVVHVRDAMLWTHPARWFFRHAWVTGQSPFWNPNQGLGFPAVADPLYGFFYPPSWLYLAVPERLLPAMVTWQSLAHLAWGGVGMVVLARRLGAGALGAAVAGLAWALSGHTTSAWTAGVLVFAQAWIPWCGVGFVALARHLDQRHGRARAVALAALPVGMSLLLGEVFVTLMAVAFGVGTALATRPPRRFLAGAAAAVGVAFLIGAAAVWPAAGLAGDGERGHAVDRREAEAFSLHPFRLVELAAPGAMGDPFADYPAGRTVGEPFSADRPLTDNVYLGASVLALALLAFGRGRPLPPVLAALAAAALLVALGRHTPFHLALRTLVPPLARMRFPEKYLVLTVGWVALLAGLGAARLPATWRRPAVLTLALLAVAALAPALFPAGLAPHVRAGALRGAAAAAIGAALIARAPALLLVLVAVDLGAAVWPLRKLGPLAVDPPPAARAVLDDFGAHLAPPRLFRAEGVEHAVALRVPVDSFSEGAARSARTLAHNAVITNGIATVGLYDAALPPALGLIGYLARPGEEGLVDVLRLFGVSYAVLEADAPPVPGLHPLGEPLPGARLYRVLAPRPRVYLAARTEVVPDRAAVRRLFEPDVVAGRLALLAPEAAPPATGAGGDCRLTSFANTRLVARCQASRDGVAVFVEQHARGWRAEVDGHPARLWRANVFMRAVPVPAGEHEIRLSYRAPLLSSGLVATLLGAVAVAGALIIDRRRAG